MKAILVCPSDRHSVAFLGQHRPLALAPILGRTLIDVWLAELATRGARHVIVLAADRPDRIRAAVGSGEAWGIRVEVQPEKNESTPEQARARHRSGEGWLPEPWDVTVLDSLPSGSPPLWSGCADWFEILRQRLGPLANQRVGMRELAPGIAVHVRSHISSSARLDPPCWIGDHAWIGPAARIGPNTIIEEAAFVDDGAEVVNSLVGPSTYVGAFTEVRDSIAWGRDLLRWTTGAHVEITDDFLLNDLSDHTGRSYTTPIPARALAAVLLLLVSPAFAIAWLRRSEGCPLFVRHQSVLAPARNLEFSNTCVHWHLAPFRGLWRRLPELWNIARGEFAWVGNRPVSPAQAALFQNEFERLWLAAPCGLFSLADTEDCPDPFGDEARAHASFYAVRRQWKSDLQILGRILKRHLLPRRPPPAPVPLPATPPPSQP
jgi:hypothetical protein